jgi:hypothetical protein
LVGSLVAWLLVASQSVGFRTLVLPLNVSPRVNSLQFCDWRKDANNLVKHLANHREVLPNLARLNGLWPPSRFAWI